MDRVQTFIENTTWGRVLITAFVAATITAIVFTNLPGSVPVRYVDPYIEVTGLGQNWGVFSPNPRRISVELQARLTFADGSQRVWEPPDPGPWVGTYRRYRWRKWADRVRLDANEETLWSATARWVARIHEDPGRTVVRVTLIRRWAELPPPGSADREEEWNEYPFFTLELAEYR